MSSRVQFDSTIFNINDKNFEKFTIETFNFQWKTNKIYRQYCKLLSIHPSQVKKISDLPYLPIEFYKNHEIKSGDWITSKYFESSGTTGAAKSIQHVKSESFYHQICQQTFNQRFGPIHQYHIYALLPSYLEQGASSLVSMVDHFIRNAVSGGFYQSNFDELHEAMTRPTTHKRILIGVTYALLQFAEKYRLPPSRDLIVIETGGMKGRGKELTREELHPLLQSAFGVDCIYSEYGMTELTSQAYAKNTFFSFPPWARVVIRDIDDPFQIMKNKQVGGINIIDLANRDTCSFIETRDLGKMNENGTFEVLGRFDNSDIRGCNLLF